MRGFLFAVLFACGLTANAQVFKCVKGGKTTFQEQACDQGSTQSKPVAVKVAGSRPLPWTDLTYGMTVEEVQKKVAEAKSGTNDSLFNGARQLLRVDKVTVAGTSFDAGFYFLGGRFLRVNLSGSMFVDNEDNKRNFERVLVVFRSRFGAEVKNNLSSSYSGLSGGADWVLEEGQVWASVLPITARTSMLNVGFVPAIRR